ncbi:ribonuclease R [candidate division KSB1 bacterium]|nr:ribonuclease R [candidate division KSB1 bacterium]
MNLDKELLSFLEQNSNRTFKPKELARQFKVSQAEYTAFRKLLKRMIADAKIVKYKRGRIGLVRKSKYVVGRIDAKTQGYAFLVRENVEKDIFISHLNMGTAFDGDLVKVELFADNRRGHNLEGRVVEVVQRTRSTFVGTYHVSRHWNYVVPDNMKIQRDIYIPAEKSAGAQSGQKVVVRLDVWENEHINPEGEIVEILGFAHETGVDVLSVAKSFDLSTAFPRSVEQTVQQFPNEIPQSEIQRRLDLRDQLIFTIDPDDAKDFDDAISLRILENGNYELGVHIADVSYYVQPKSAIDREAYERGTSIYLVDRVIPMLPERLSNNLCSLVPDQDRLCMTVLMELNADGRIITATIHESIIHSKRRFTYEDVQKIIEQKKPKDKFAKTIHAMQALNLIRQQQRYERGGLDFGSNEVKIELDETGKPIAIKKREQLDSHRLVEEFMILANTAVATQVGKILQQQLRMDVPFPYRIHEKPDKDKLRVFIDYIQALGIERVNRKQLNTPRAFQQVLETISDADKKVLVQNMMVRSMMKAKYATENVGHFGLALKFYSHFTSPIRRYPDLVCHRLLKAYCIEQQTNAVSPEWLKAACEHATQREIVAQDAERASTKIKQLEFMEQHVGQEFAGIISGVVQFGIFVEITEYLVEGLVHISNLPDDYYVYDEKRFSLLGKHSGREYQLGDHVQVVVVKVNRDAQLLDFELVED